VQNPAVPEGFFLLAAGSLSLWGFPAPPEIALPGSIFYPDLDDGAVGRPDKILQMWVFAQAIQPRLAAAFLTIYCIFIAIAKVFSVMTYAL
jgi:hypothetical protein